MKYRRRTFYSDTLQSEMWGRWQCGESMSSLRRRFDRASSSVSPYLAAIGGESIRVQTDETQKAAGNAGCLTATIDCETVAKP